MNNEEHQFEDEIDLPIVNKSNHEHYLTYYDEESKNIVKEFFKKEIKYFDYRIEGKTEAAEYLDKKGLYIGNHHFDIRKQLAEISKILK